MNFNILITEPIGYSEKAIETFKSLGNLFYLNDYNKKEIDVIVIRLSIKIDALFLKDFTRLKYILSPTTGLNHIDLEWCSKKAIEVISLKGEFIFLEEINATPEYTFAVLLNMFKNINIAYGDVKKEETIHLNRLNYLASEFSELKVGIAGCGRVGKKLYRYCEKMEINVVVYDPYKDFSFFHSNQIKHEQDFEIFLRSIDVLVICISYSIDNENYFSKDRLEMLKSGSMVINTARGEVLDEMALLDMLEQKKLKSAALDVLSIENTVNYQLEGRLFNYLKNNNNLLLTPHIAGASRMSMLKTEEYVAKKFKKIIFNERNINCN